MTEHYEKPDITDQEKKKKDIRKEVRHTMKEKYEKPDVTDQEKLDATSGAQNMLPYEPYLPFTPSGNVPYTGGQDVTFAGPIIAAFSAVIAAGGSMVGWFSRRGARKSSRNDEDVS